VKTLALLIASLCCLGQAYASQKVVLEIDDDYAPYSYLEGTQLKGLYVDYLRWIGSRLAPAYTLELRPVPWKRGLSNLEAGDSFGLLPAYRVSTRSYISHYSQPLSQDTVVLFCTDTVMAKAHSRFPQDFIGLTIGVNLGFELGEKMASAKKAQLIEVKENKGNDLNLIDLWALNIDCYANDRVAVQYSAAKLRKDPRILPFRKIQLREATVISTEDSVVAYSLKNNPAYKADFIRKLDAALLAGKKAGKLEQIIANSKPN
jgi:polar amino acid transport system substrate-binding protein